MINPTPALRPDVTRPRNAPEDAFWMLLALSGVTALIDLLYFYQVFVLGAEALLPLALGTLIFCAMSVLGAFLARRGRVALGTWLVLGVMFALWPATVLFMVADIGIILAFSPLLLSLGLVQFLPKPQDTIALVLSIAISLSTVMLDVFNIAGIFEISRFSIAEFQFQLAAAVSFLVIIYGYFFLGQFAGYTIRQRLIIAFVVVTILAVGGVSAAADFAIRQNIIADTEADLSVISTVQSQIIGDNIAGKVEDLVLLVDNTTIRSRVIASQASTFDNGQADVPTVLADLEAQWQRATDTAAIVQFRLANTGVQEMRRFRQNVPDLTNFILTDQHGTLVSAIDRPATITFAEETWWQATYNNGNGAIHIGVPRVDPVTEQVFIRIAVPVFDEVRGDVLGVMQADYDFTSIVTTFGNLRIQEGQAPVLPDLLVGGQIFSLHADELQTSEETIEEVNAATLSELQALPSGDTRQLTYEDEFSILSVSNIRSATGLQAINQLDWRVIVHVEQADVLAPIRQQQRLVLLVGLVIVGVAVLIAWGVARLLASPIDRLTNTALRVSAGNYGVRARVEAQDEVGMLATAFNTMTGQLRDVIANLEDRVADRTRRLETVVKISQRLTSILDLSDLLRQVVNLTKEIFGYYHVHIYLIDEKQELLLLAAGYGEAGREMLRQGHSISLSSAKSLVAQAARERRVVTVPDVKEDPNWLPNPLLPLTQSEMAIPVELDHEVVGVLDVQSSRIGGLTEEDETTLLVLAAQIAVAVRNARLFSETQEKLYEAQRLQKLYTTEAWQKLTGNKKRLTFVHKGSHVDLPDLPLDETLKAIEAKKPMPLGGNGSHNGSATEQEEPTASPLTKGVAAPLRLRDQVIGVLGIQNDDPNRKWTEDELALIEAVSEQMTLALENARLFEETTRQAGRQRTIADLTQKVWSSGDIEQVMQTAIQELGTTLNASKVTIRLGTVEQLASPPEPEDEKE